MTTFTCQQSSDKLLDRGQIYPIHSLQSSEGSSFLYIPSLAKNHDTAISAIDVSASPSISRHQRDISPCFAVTSDTKSFYTTVEVCDINSEPEGLSQMERTARGPNRSTDSMEGQPEKSKFLPKEKCEQLTPKKKSSSSTKSTSRDFKYQKTGRSRASSYSVSRGHSASGSVGSRSSSEARTTSSNHARRHSLGARRVDQHLIRRQTDRDLVSLHRESCRLFEQATGTDNVMAQRKEERIRRRDSKLSTTTTPTLSPRLHPTISPSLECHALSTTTDHHAELASTENLEPHSEPEEEYTPLPATVIDWTSPSTRRREYEEIDRSSRGVRGLWRRFAPTWCQSRERRTLFFGEGKGGKEMYEGSVRRFRMDVPDGDEDGCGKDKEVLTRGKATIRWFENKAFTTDDITGRAKKKKTKEKSMGWKMTS